MPLIYFPELCLHPHLNALSDLLGNLDIYSARYLDLKYRKISMRNSVIPLELKAENFP